MHCWKTINVQREYGPTRLAILCSIIFVIVFSLSFVFLSPLPPALYNDDFIWVFFICIFVLYPIHKLVHYYSLFNYRKNVKIKVRFELILIVNIRIKNMIPKKRYIFTLLSPFIILNSALVLVTLYYPQYSHYSCLLLAMHCSMCLIDLLFIKDLAGAPKEAVIEETPKGYEILVPPNF